MSANPAGNEPLTPADIVAYLVDRKNNQLDTPAVLYAIERRHTLPHSRDSRHTSHQVSNDRFVHNNNRPWTQGPQASQGHDNHSAL